jgi:TolB-like protein/Tfp pilus assembly protein PilF
LPRARSGPIFRAMSQQPNSLQSFFAEMMRRRVFRVMAVYGAVAFVVLQVADIMFPALGLPEWAMTMVLAITMLGFPIAIVLAWAFESTPDGMRRTAPAAPEEIQEIVAAPMKHRWPAGMLALAGMGLLFWAGWWMGNRGAENPANIIVSEAHASEFKALAVLPFEDVNETEDNRLIAVGVHEDLLSQLSRIAALRVTSRTSVREYENTEKGLKEIADELGVEFIMEGSVRSAGNQVRVTVTLIDANTDELIWNHQYDKEVTPDNLFQIQSEVARSVVAELEAELTPQDEETLDAMKPASSLAAQSWYYRGIEGYAGGLSELEQARDDLKRAVELDPGFTAAWSHLAQVESRRLFVGQTDDDADAARAMERTVELAPQSVEAHLATGYYEYYGQRDFDAAIAAFREAERLAPSSSEAAWAVGLILRRQGDWDGSTEMMKRAVQLDPRNVLRLETLAENLHYTGALSDADAVSERQLAIDPTNHRARSRKILLLVDLDGNTGRAGRLARELGLDPANHEESVALGRLAWDAADYARVVELTELVDVRGVVFIERGVQAARALALHRLGDPSAVAIADSLLAGIEPESMREAEVPAYRALAHAIAGRRDDALREAQDAERLIRRWVDHVINPQFAVVALSTYGIIGELDAGFALFDDLIERPAQGVTVSRLRLDSQFDPYRDDPRFDDLIRRREAFEAEGQRKGEAGRPWLP